MMDRQIGFVSVVMQTLYWYVVVKRELSEKVKLSIYKSVYTLVTSCGSDRKNKMVDTSNGNEFPPKGVWAYL